MVTKKRTPANIIRKIFKLGLRGMTTIFIPIFALPLFKNFPLFGGIALQCGFLISIPLWIIWIQTIIAWVDDSLGWIQQ